ncbi:hypothetical protein GCM10023185_08380 [Hymenobacter saemangeumensis]|uniref:PKD domain-containing protein n=1 Tax=Hymenobacter saemangeumensis TaxID=1084522 RepID=A0ABP8I3X2_9BACT
MFLLFPFSCPPLRRLILGALTLAALPLPGIAASTPGASLEFIPNKGQWDSHVRYAAPLSAGRLFLQSTAFTYSLVDGKDLQHHGTPEAAASPAEGEKMVAGHAYTVHFEQANPRPRITAETPTAEVRNYFIGSDARRWASNVPSFRRVKYAELWTGIGLQVYENQDRQLEYDFLLAAQTNPARIALRYEGADNVRLDARGNLVVKTTVGTVQELAPKAWQTTAGGQRQPVACRYALQGSTVSFVLGAYDKTRPLTIDPTVVFSSFTASTADNWGFTATYDQQGNMYSGGIAFSLGFPTTNGAFSTRWAGLSDIAIIKYNPAVTGAASRVWATYLGGILNDYPHSMVTNAQGELVMLGSTSSRDYPTTSGAISRSHAGGSTISPFGSSDATFQMAGGSDLVVTRLNATGSLLVASTYLGGSGNDGVLATNSPLTANYGDSFRSDILLDGAGNVFIASNTNSPSFHGFSGYRGGGSDGLLCKLSPNLTTVLWARYVGGSGADALYSVQLAPQGRVYASGGTTSTGLATPGSYLNSYQGGDSDGVVVSYSATGVQEAATYVGTASYDQAQFLQLDALGNAYLLGQTTGSFPRTPGLYGNANGNLFIQKLSADLTASAYSTAFGGPTLVPTAFLVDDCERVYISGWGGHTNGGYLGGSTSGLPTTANAVRATTDGSDFYLAQFTPGMTRLEYGSFFGIAGVGPNGEGAEHVDGGTSRFDKRGVVYQAVCGGCRSQYAFPVPPGANTYSPTKGNSGTNCNNAAFKIDFQPVVANPGPRRTLCLENGPVALGGSPAGGTWTGPGVRLTAAGGYEFVPLAVGAGQHMLTYTVATTGVCQATLRVRYLVAPAVVPTMATVPPQCVSGEAITVAATPSGGSFSGRGMSGNRFSPQAAGPGTHTITYTVSDSLGCGTTSQQVIVSAQPPIAAGPDTTLCADRMRPFQLRGQSPAGGTWSGTGVTAGGLFTPPNTNNRGGVFRLTYTVDQPPCRVTAVRTVVLAPASSVDAGLNLPVCATAPQYAGLAPFDCTLNPVLIAPNAIYEWDFGDGSAISNEASPRHLFEKPGTYRVRLTARYANCDVLTQFAPLEVGKVFVPNIITPNGDQANDTFRPLFSCEPASLKVFSRWGQQVYATDSYANNWRAEGLAAGLYYYLLKDIDGRTVKGWVEVVK